MLAHIRADDRLATGYLIEGFNHLLWFDDLLAGLVLEAVAGTPLVDLLVFEPKPNIFPYSFHTFLYRRMMAAKQDEYLLFYS